MCIHPQICILCCSSHKRLLQYIAFLPALHVIRFKYNINVVEPKYGHSNHTGKEDSLLPVSAVHGQWQLTSAYHTPEPQHVQGLNLILFSFFFIYMPFLGWSFDSYSLSRFFTCSVSQKTHAFTTDSNFLHHTNIVLSLAQQHTL